MYCGELRLAESEHIYVDGIAYCDEHDIGTFGTCLRGERTCVLEMLGRWDEAESLAAALLQQAGPSPLTGSTRSSAWARCGRGAVLRMSGTAWTRR